MLAEQIREKVQGTWGTVIRALAPGLSFALDKGKKHQPCPKCGGKDRFNFDQDFPNNGKAYCNHKCSLNVGGGIDLLMAWNNWPLNEALEKINDFLGGENVKDFSSHVKDEFQNAQKQDNNAVNHPPNVKGIPPHVKKTDFTLKIISECQQDDLRISSYFEHRGLSGDVPKICTLHKNLYHKCKDGSVKHEQALVTPITSVHGNFLGIQRIYLAGTHYGKSDNQPNKMIGKTNTTETLNGGSVKLSEPEEYLCVSEGIETAVAVQEMTGQPTWAGVTAAMMATMDIPERIRYLWIYADKDEKGVKAAETLATKYTEKGVKCYIKYPAGEGDWLDEYVKNGKEAMRTSPTVLFEVPKFKQEQFIETRNFDNYKTEAIKMPHPIIQGIINEQEVIVLSGPPKLGKSLLACNLAMCAAAGHDWFDFYVPRPMKVLYLQRELGDAWMQHRAKKIDEGFANYEYLTKIYEKAGVEIPETFDPHELGQNLFIPEPVNFKIDDDEDWAKLTAQIQREKYDLIIIDPLFCMIKGNENDTKDMTKVLDNLIELKTVCKCSVLLIHHFGKGTGTIKGAHAHRGSSVIGGGSDGNITFKLLEDDLIGPNGLKGNPGEFGVLSFEMRNGQPITDMIMWRNPDYLIWERCKKGVNRDKGKESDGVSIVDLMSKHGEPIPLTDLVILMLENGWTSARTARRRVTQLIDKRLLITKKVDGHGTAMMILLPEWEL